MVTGPDSTVSHKLMNSDIELKMCQSGCSGAMLSRSQRKQMTPRHKHATDAAPYLTKVLQYFIVGRATKVLQYFIVGRAGCVRPAHCETTAYRQWKNDCACKKCHASATPPQTEKHNKLRDENKRLVGKGRAEGGQRDCEPNDDGDRTVDGTEEFP